MALKHSTSLILVGLFSIALLLLLFLLSPKVDFNSVCKGVAKERGLNPEEFCDKTASVRPTDPLYITRGYCYGSKAWPGFQASTLKQWLFPLAAWVFPGFGLLLLSPVAENAVPCGVHYAPSAMQKLKGSLKELWFSTGQYLIIISDPASAFSGIISEVEGDVELCYMAKNKVTVRDQQEKERLSLVLCCVTVAGQVRCTESTLRPMQFLIGCRGSARYARAALRGMMGGRIKFNSGVLLPSLMYCGGLAVLFHEIHAERLGDNDASLSLAYALWYIWLLPLAVLSNCYGSNLNADSVQTSLQNIAGTANGMDDCPGWDSKRSGHDSFERFKRALNPGRLDVDSFASHALPCETTELRDRFLSSLKWRRWVEGLDIEGAANSSVAVAAVAKGRDRSRPPEHRLTAKELARYMLYQLLGWVPVAVSCVGAYIVAYTTPKVTLSCRSLNIAVYFTLTLVASLSRPLSVFISLRHSPYLSPPTFPGFRGILSLSRILAFLSRALICIILNAPRSLYALSAVSNAFLFVGGSLFQLSGVYRNCVCWAGLLPSELHLGAEMQIASLTHEHIYNARKYWGVVTCTLWVLVLVICVAGLWMKQYIVRVLARWGGG